MNENSALMIYQHFPREDHEEYLERRAAELKREVTRDWPIYVSDNEIIFFFLTKKDILKKRLRKIIIDYEGHYPNLDLG
jgi:hypothetical protein